MEPDSRRLVQLEMAAARNPSAPDFTGLGVIGDGVTQADGSSRVPRFRHGVAERLKERSDILKQNRIYSEGTRQHKRPPQGKHTCRGKDNDEARGSDE